MIVKCELTNQEMCEALAPYAVNKLGLKGNFTVDISFKAVKESGDAQGEITATATIRIEDA